MTDFPVGLMTILSLIDTHIERQRAQREGTDDNPIVRAIDRAGYMGGELALVNLKNALLEAVTTVAGSLKGRERA